MEKRIIQFFEPIGRDYAPDQGHVGCPFLRIRHQGVGKGTARRRLTLRPNLGLATAEVGVGGVGVEVYAVAPHGFDQPVEGTYFMSRVAIALRGDQTAHLSGKRPLPE